MAACLGLVVAAAAGARADVPVAVPFAEQAPRIDGVLDDAVWSRAASLAGFVQTQPGDNTAASRDTSVLLAYDADSLFVAVRAADDPQRVRATLARRDDILADDYVRLLLDTYHDHRRAYLIAFNPLGVQQDGLFVEGAAAPDYSFDVVMESRGRITTSGYEIEARIPFRSLRFAVGAGRTWGVHVQRYIRHLDGEEDSWRPLVRGRASLLEQAGAISGFERIGASRSLEIIPTVVGSQFGARRDGRFEEGHPGFSPSLTAKVNLSSSLVIDAAVNPDFAQVEADDLVVTANQRFPIFFAEKRPFFLEGIDLFRTPLQLVDTRRVVDPDFAAKVSGKSGRTGFALMLARDDTEAGSTAAGDAAVVRVRRDVGNGSSLGLLGTLRRLGERHNTVVSADGRLQLGPGSVLAFQAAGTDAGARGFGYRVEASRKSRHFANTLSAEGRSSGYAADLGFTLQRDVNNLRLDTRYDSEPRPGGALIQWSLLNTSLVQGDWRSRLKYLYAYPGIELTMAKETKLTVRGYADYLRVFAEELDEPFDGRQERRTVYRGYVANLVTAPRKTFSASLLVTQSWDVFDYDFGASPRYPRVSPAALADPLAPLDPGPGHSFDLDLRVEWKPTPPLRLSASHTRSRLTRNDTGRLAYDQALYSATVARQFGRFGFCRVRTDWDTLQGALRGQLVAGWTPNPGTAVYFGYDDDFRRDLIDPQGGLPDPALVRSGRAFFVKLSYLLRQRL